VAAVAIACALVAASATASTALVARGRAGSLPWHLRVTSRTINARPGICVSFMWALRPGQKIGNGASTCYIAAKGLPTGGLPTWTFTLQLGAAATTG
jgi:hypothetical protein